jgi:hypothetical protein
MERSGKIRFIMPGNLVKMEKHAEAGAGEEKKDRIQARDGCLCVCSQLRFRVNRLPACLECVLHWRLARIVDLRCGVLA